MAKLSLLEKIVLPPLSFVATSTVGLSPLLFGTYNDESINLMIAANALTPFLIAAGNAAIQKSHYNRDIFSKDNLKALALSGTGALGGWAFTSYLWYSFYQVITNLNSGFGI
ncbi:MAG: hypothetical protein ABH840_02150 [Nanoarchaeota archaeon]